MDAIRIEFDDAGIQEMLKSPGVVAELEAIARKVAVAGDGVVEVKTKDTRAVAGVKVDKAKYAQLCKSGRPYQHPNCTASKALRDAHVKLLAAL